MSVIVGTSRVQTVAGHVMKGPLVGAHVRLYRIDPNGRPAGSPVAHAVTDPGGYWSTRVRTPREPLLVVAAGGRYVDETDSSPVQAARRVVELGPLDQIEGVLPAQLPHLTSRGPSSLIVCMKSGPSWPNCCVYP